MEATESVIIQLIYFLAEKLNVFIYLIMHYIVSSLLNEKIGNLCVTSALLLLGRSKHWHLLVDWRNDVFSHSRSLLIQWVFFFQFRWYEAGTAHVMKCRRWKILFPELLWKFRIQFNSIDHRSGNVSVAWLYVVIWGNLYYGATQQFRAKCLIREVNYIENRWGRWTFYFNFWYCKV